MSSFRHVPWMIATGVTILLTICLTALLLPQAPLPPSQQTSSSESPVVRSGTVRQAATGHSNAPHGALRSPRSYQQPTAALPEALQRLLNLPSTTVQQAEKQDGQRHQVRNATRPEDGSILRIDEWFTADRLERREISVRDQFVGRLSAGVTPAQLRNQLAAHGARLLTELDNHGTVLIGFDGTDPQKRDRLISRLSKGVLDYGEPDYIVWAIGTPDDSQFNDLWGMHNTGQNGGTADADIDAPEAWDLHTGSRQVVVGVIDTGIDYRHPDLSNNIWANPGETGTDSNGNDKATNGIDDDGNGFIDDARGWDFVNNDNDAFDDHYHGTHCAGTVGASGNNALGVTGVCWQVSLVPIKFLSSGGSGNTSNAIRCVDYARTIGVHLTSNSWGGGSFSQSLKDAIERAGNSGQLFVAAAGNNYADSDRSPAYPAAYDSPSIISVAATTRTDAKAGFSNWGLTSVDLGAPGDGILSTYPNNSYRYLNGTSMACPHVAGACAMLWSMAPSSSAGTIKDTILSTVDTVASMDGRTVSGGRLNLFKAMQAMGPQLTVQQQVLIADGSNGSSGDGDGLFNPGETVIVTVTVANVGGRIANDISASLSLDSAISGVTITDNHIAVGTLPGGGQVTRADSFAIQIANNTATPSTLQASITLSADNETWTESLSFPIVVSTDVAGTVTAETGGAPIANAVVQAQGSTTTYSTNTAADGSWSLRLPAGSYQVAATHSDWLPSSTQAVTTPPDANNIAITLGRPLVAVTPNPVTATVSAGSSSNSILTINNTGDRDLHWQLHGVDATASPTDAGGPDAFGYRWKDSNEADGPTYVWEDISSSGRRLNVSNLSSGYESVPLTFSFPFYGIDYSSVFVSTNGLLSFGQGFSSSSNRSLPSDTIATPIIAAFWDHFRPSTHGDIYALDDGERLIIQYEEVASGFSSSYRSSFQIVLNRFGDIFLYYKTMQGLLTSATIGTQNTDGASGLEVVHNAAYVQDGLAVAIRYTPDWLSAAQLSGTITGGASTNITLDIDASTKLAGMLTHQLSLSHNALNEADPIIVPVSVTVNGTPQLRSDVTSLTFADTTVGQAQQVDLTLINDGTAATTVNSLTISGAAFSSLSSAPITVPAKAQTTVPMIFSPTTAGAQNGQLTIASDASDNPSIAVTLSGTGILGSRLAANPSSLQLDTSANSIVTGQVALSNDGDRSTTWQISNVELTGAANSPQGGGPDAFGYIWLDSDDPGGPSYVWNDISSTGTRILTSSHGTTSVSLPFAFPFYGSNHSSCFVSYTGLVSFGSAITDSTADALPSSTDPYGIISAFWGHLHPSTSGAVYSKATANSFTIQYENVYDYSFNGYMTYQVVLHADGQITFYYKRLSGGSTRTTVGIQNPGATTALQIDHRGTYLKPAHAVTIKPRTPWLSVDATSGTLNAGTSTNLTFTANNDEWPVGTHNVDVFVFHDASNQPSPMTIPVSMIVPSQPKLTATPNPADFASCVVGQAKQLPITLTNAGNDTLTISAISSDDSQFSTNSTLPLTIAAGASIDLDFVATLTATGAQTANVTITSNAVDNPSLTIPISANGFAGSEFRCNPSQHSLTIASGTTTNLNIPISNDGDLACNYRAMTPDATGVPTDGQGSGYSWRGSSNAVGPIYNWHDIATADNRLALSDSSYALQQVTLPFYFDYFGQRFGQVHISTRGVISFSGAYVNSYNYRLPTYGAPNYSIAAYWDDLNPALGGDIYYAAVGTDHAIIQYQNVRLSSFNSTVSFQIILHRSGAILCQYQDLAGDQSSASIGLQGSSGAQGLHVSYNAPFTNSNTAIFFQPDAAHPNLLALDQQSGSLAASSTAQRSLAIDSNQLYAGHYSKTVLFTHDASNSISPSAAQIDLTVTGSPRLRITPPNVNFGELVINSNSTGAGREVRFHNEGTAPVTISATNSNNTNFFMREPLPITIQPGRSIVYDVYCLPTSAGTHTGTITILSDASDNPIITLPVTVDAIVGPRLNFNLTRLDASMDYNAQHQVPVTLSNDGDRPSTYHVSYIESDDPIGPASWVSATPVSGSLAPGESRVVTFTFDSTGMNPARHTGTIFFLSNAVNVINNVQMSFAVTVASQPRLVADTVFTHYDTPVTEVRHRNFTIANQGNANLVISSLNIPAPFGLVSPVLPITIAPGDDTNLRLSFSPTAEGPISTDMTIFNNADANGRRSITLQATGLSAPLARFTVEMADTTIEQHHETMVTVTAIDTLGQIKTDWNESTPIEVNDGDTTHYLSTTSLQNWTDGVWKGPLRFDVLGINMILHADHCDHVGNSQPFTVTPDITPPVVTVTSLITNDTAPIIRGTASDGELTIEVAGRRFQDGDSALTRNGEDWQLQWPDVGPLADGVYEVTATARDRTGNLGFDRSINELTIDTRPPPPPAVTALHVQVGSLATWTWTGTGTGTNAGNGTFRFGLQGQTLTTGPGVTTHSDGSLAVGVHVLEVQEQDAAGNWSSSGTARLVVYDLSVDAITVDGHLRGGAAPSLRVDDQEVPIQEDGNWSVERPAAPIIEFTSTVEDQSTVIGSHHYRVEETIVPLGGG